MALSFNLALFPSVRNTHFIAFLGCVFLMLVGAYLEHVLKLLPCPLCITQRAFIVLTGLIGLAAAIHNPAACGQRCYAALGILAALSGAFVSHHHMWLQSLPADQAPACGPGLAYMFEVFPMIEAIKLLFQGDGTCSLPHIILGLTIPTWTFIAFLGLAVINVYQLLRQPVKSTN
jgi:protein dithiol:quinone oxidoreductase